MGEQRGSADWGRWRKDGSGVVVVVVMGGWGASHSKSGTGIVGRGRKNEGARVDKTGGTGGCDSRIAGLPPLNDLRFRLFPLSFALII